METRSSALATLGELRSPYVVNQIYILKPNIDEIILTAPPTSTVGTGIENTGAANSS